MAVSIGAEAISDRREQETNIEFDTQRRNGARIKFVSLELALMVRFPPDITDIRLLEEELHRRAVRRSRAALETLLADDFVEFGASGTIYNRNSIINHLVQDDIDGIDDILTSNYAMKIISDGAVLLTYDSECTQADGARRHVLRSSIWKHNGDRWQMLFHQGTIKKRA